MTARLRDAARRALSTVAPEEGDPEVRRCVLELSRGDATELVTVTLRGEELTAVAADGSTDGPWVSAALRFLAGDEGERGRTEPDPRITTSPGIRTAEGGEEPGPPADRAALADALMDVVTAVARVGVREASRAASVEEGLVRIRTNAPDPLPSGVARFIGRLRAALGDDSTTMVARLLEEAARLAADLRESRPDPEGRRRIESWLGVTGGLFQLIPMYERTLVEVGREWLPGAERAGIERRYLVDVEQGHIYREERPRGGPASIGPCPRVITVGLGEVEGGAAPRRLRLLQYAVSNVVDTGTWSKVSACAVRRFHSVGDDYRSALRAHPGLAEPFAIIAPASFDREDTLVPLDDEGEPLALAHADDPGAVARLKTLTEEGRVAWIAGRLTDSGGAVMLLPVSAAVGHAGRTELHRLR